MTDGEEQALRGQVAAYIAKYATKSTEAVGGLVHRLEASDLRGLRVREHVRGYIESAWRLGGDERLEYLRLRRWAHALAYRGHCFTKSRRYSTTFTALRQARADYAAGRKPGAQPARDPWGRPADETATKTLSDWHMVGIGYRTEGDAWLASSSAARAREHRALARDELRSAHALSLSNAT